MTACFKPAKNGYRKDIGAVNEGISNAYVYVVAGEEETLSVKDGNFSLKTWQPLPLVLVIEHKDFKKQRIVIRAAAAGVSTSAFFVPGAASIKKGCP